MRPDCVAADTSCALHLRAFTKQAGQPGQRRPLGAKKGSEPAVPCAVNRRGRRVNHVSWQRAQQQRARRVLEVHPLEVALTVEDGELAQAPERCAAVVAYH